MSTQWSSTYAARTLSQRRPRAELLHVGHEDVAFDARGRLAVRTLGLLSNRRYVRMGGDDQCRRGLQRGEIGAGRQQHRDPVESLNVEFLLDGERQNSS